MELGSLWRGLAPGDNEEEAPTRITTPSDAFHDELASCRFGRFI